MHNFSEAESVRVGTSLQQGDVIEATDGEAPIWQRYLIVITADCDLAHNKHNGRLTCVPALTVEDYIARVHLAKRRELAADALIGELQPHLANTSVANVPAARLREWMASEEPSEVVEDMGVTGELAERVYVTGSTVRDVSDTESSLARATDALLRGAVLTGSKDRSAAARELSGYIKNAFKSTPGDALFLSAIAPSLDGGFFAYLRHHETVWATDIALGVERVAYKYRRIGRLKERYSLALVHKFAGVFMSIGLPAEYEGSRDVYAEVLREGIK
ncbi:hypothetical protein [Microbacterium sp. lyk4-40-TSB-66]|uniref:hypothetical protein n=1 Tax=Microbacterium sp. lyk4-40-TSB-66 TaxID=3040294 RepID=UPI00254F015B|nr:hypothetical protein [Microbacterium sp. lyk4-40-TSB-66]